MSRIACLPSKLHRSDERVTIQKLSKMMLVIMNLQVVLTTLEYSREKNYNLMKPKE